MQDVYDSRKKWRPLAAREVRKVRKKGEEKQKDGQDTKTGEKKTLNLNVAAPAIMAGSTKLGISRQQIRMA